jgi:hypothetical protein
MRRFAHLVNPFFFSHHDVLFCEGANYSKRSRGWQGLFSRSLFCAVHSPFLADCRTAMAYISGDRYSCIIKKFVTLLRIQE